MHRNSVDNTPDTIFSVKNTMLKGKRIARNALNISADSNKQMVSTRRTRLSVSRVSVKKTHSLCCNL